MAWRSIRLGLNIFSLFGLGLLFSFYINTRTANLLPVNFLKQNKSNMLNFLSGSIIHCYIWERERGLLLGGK